MKLLVTPRLLMRPFAESDLDDLAALYADPNVRRFFASGKLTREETAERLRQTIADFNSTGFGMLAVIERREKRLIGRCGLKYLDGSSEIEIGYLLEAKSWGKGYATEAAKEVMRYAFGEMKLPRLVAVTDAQNHASRRVLEKLGMKHTGMGNFYGREAMKYEIANTFMKPFAYSSQLAVFAYL